MKIKISWSAFSNITFKGSKIIEIDDEGWEVMDEQERDKFLFEKAIEKSGFEYYNEIIE